MKLAEDSEMTGVIWRLSSGLHKQHKANERCQRAGAARRAGLLAECWRRQWRQRQGSKE